MQYCLIVDLDGTLCERTNHPNIHTGEEVVVEKIEDEIHKAWMNNRKIIILTGRKYADHYETTKQWLIDNNIPYDHLIMNKDSQPEENHIFKKRVLKILSQMYHIEMVYDDNPAVGEVCRKMKIPFYPCY